MTTLNERDMIALLLVQAVEEHDPSFFRPEVLSEAALAAIDARTDAELLDKRTHYLRLRLPPSIRAWERVALLPEHSLGMVIPATFVVGALSNYLGPSGLVHVAYNPLGFLIAWNVGVFVFLAWRRLVRFRSPSSTVQAPSPGAEPSRRDDGAREVETPRSRGGLLHLLVPELWLWWNRWTARLRTTGTRIKNLREVSAAFLERYWDAAHPVVVARVEQLAHLGAIGLLLGALVGTYVRGFFFDYNAVWRSTFLTDPTSVATFLNLLLGPASLLIDGALLTPADVEPLLRPEGTGAGPWIHRLALMGVLVVVIPRAVLAGIAGRRARSRAARMQLDLSQDYCLRTIRAAREGQIHRVREGIASAIRRELGKLAESVALLVRDRFFDKIVAPTLVGFRNQGGRIADLEAELAADREAFEPELREHVRAEQTRFQTSVATDIRAVVGRELTDGAEVVLDDVSPVAVSVHHGVTGSVAADVGDAIGATVTAAVSAGVATISGGVGETLGLAILSSLLGTSGPIGLLLGGIAGAAVVGGAYLLGRDRMTAAVKRQRLPAMLVAMALRDAKLERARDDTYAQVKRQIQDRIDPIVTETTAAVLRQLSLAIAKRQEDTA